MIESCFHENDLPNNTLFININAVISFLDTISFLFSIFIIYISPPSKEDKVYKYITSLQHISLGLVAMMWYICSYGICSRLGLLYTEGIINYTFLNGANMYFMLIILFGCFMTALKGAYLYRLRVISHENHILKKPYVFYGYLFFFFPIYTFVLAACFSMGYILDPNALGNPIQTLSVKEALFLIERKVFWFRFTKISNFSYMFLFGFYLIYVSVILIVCSRQILSEIKKKEITASSSTLRHQKKVFKVLSLQTMGTIAIMIPAPFAVLLQILINSSMCITQTAVSLFGLSFFVNTVLLLLLNVSYRQTIISLFKNNVLSSNVSEIVKRIGIVNGQNDE